MYLYLLIMKNSFVCVCVLNFLFIIKLNNGVLNLLPPKIIWHLLRIDLFSHWFLLPKWTMTNCVCDFAMLASGFWVNAIILMVASFLSHGNETTIMQMALVQIDIDAWWAMFWWFYAQTMCMFCIECNAYDQKQNSLYE